MVIVRSVAVLIVASSCACASRPLPSLKELFDTKFHIKTENVPQRSEFLVTLVSDDVRNICVSLEQWPRSDGTLHGPAGRAKLVFDDSSLSSANHNFGHCNQGLCAFVIEPGHQLKGSVSYSNFGDPEAIKQMGEMQLVFEVSPWTGEACRK